MRARNSQSKFDEPDTPRPNAVAMASKNPRKFRWWQFSIRTWMLVVAVLGLFITYETWRRSTIGSPRMPSQDDIRSLRDLKGASKWSVIYVMGWPEKQIQRDSRETWEYPWLAHCSVTFSDGQVVSTFYTGGF